MSTQSQRRSTHFLPAFQREFAALGPLAVPVAVSLLSHAVMTLVDTLFIARLGASALAGAGVAGTAYFTVLAFAAGASRAGKTLTAQRAGAGQETLALLPRVLLLGGVLTGFTLAMGAVVCAVLPFTLTGAEAQESALVYLGVLLVGAPFDCVFMAVREWHYGTGDTRRPMRASVLANALNIGLDALFVAGFDAGIGGIAAATAIASLVQCLLLVAPHRTQLRRQFRRRRATTRSVPSRQAAPADRDIRTLVRFGIPLGAQFLVETGSFFALMLVLAAHSDIAVAAHQIALQFVKLGFLPAVAVGEAAAVRAGNSIGERSVRGIRHVTWAALVAIALYVLVVGTTLAYFRADLLAWVTNDPVLIEATSPLLVIAALFLVPDGAQMVLRGVLRGVGDIRWSAFAAMTNAWLVTPPLAYVLVVVVDLGAAGGWLAITVEILLTGTLLALRLRSHGWHRHAKAMRRAAAA